MEVQAHDKLKVQTGMPSTRGFFYVGDRLKVGTTASHLDLLDLVSMKSGPVYVYDLDLVEARYRALNDALEGTPHTIHYAMKANSCSAILRRLARLGAGCDTVSGGEIKRALEAGFAPDRIVFSGVAKSVAEIELAVSNGIKQINVESPQELERIAQVASRANRKVDVAFRMNPDVSPQTHPYITTGFRENKFGMDESFIPELKSILKRSENQLRLRGLTMHIGSQLFDLEVLREAVEKTLSVHLALQAEGFKLDRFDAGGGLGVNYETADEASELAMMRDYGSMVRATVTKALGSGTEILTEPGRCLVARAGMLVGEVQYVKRAPARTFAILDTGMNHLIRPALYGAKHRIVPLRLKSGTSAPEGVYDIVGPICESSDFFAKAVSLPQVEQGDRLGIADAGAYGFAMASRYNSYDLPEEIAVSRGQVVES